MAWVKWNDPVFSEAREIHARSGLLDLHVDSILQQRLFGYDIGKRHQAHFRGQPLFWHADIPRMIEGGYKGACMGIHYCQWESERGWRELNRQIDYLDHIATEERGCLRVYHPRQWQEAKALNLLALAPCVEGAHMLNGKLERVAQLARRGIAYLTLAHFCRNAAVTPSVGWRADGRSGLTAFGRLLVRELNRYGIVVDVAHVNTPGVLDVCRESRAPLLCSHTGVKGVHGAARNISDAEIHAIAEGGGVIGVMFAPCFLRGRLKADSEAVLDHIEYVIDKVGIRHVAIGSDYDGWLPTIPDDHEDCRDVIRITHGLKKRGYSEEEVAMVIRDNALRVFTRAWELRDSELDGR